MGGGGGVRGTRPKKWEHVSAKGTMHWKNKQDILFCILSKYFFLDFSLKDLINV